MECSRRTCARRPRRGNSARGGQSDRLHTCSARPRLQSRGRARGARREGQRLRSAPRRGRRAARPRRAPRGGCRASARSRARPRPGRRTTRARRPGGRRCRAVQWSRASQGMRRSRADPAKPLRALLSGAPDPGVPLRAPSHGYAVEIARLARADREDDGATAEELGRERGHGRSDRALRDGADACHARIARCLVEELRDRRVRSLGTEAADLARPPPLASSPARAPRPTRRATSRGNRSRAPRPFEGPPSGPVPARSRRQGRSWRAVRRRRRDVAGRARQSLRRRGGAHRASRTSTRPARPASP